MCGRPRATCPTRALRSSTRRATLYRDSRQYCMLTPLLQVFKANSAVLNSLLTILNERLFDNGNERLAVPLLCLVRRSL